MNNIPITYNDNDTKFGVEPKVVSIELILSVVSIIKRLMDSLILLSATEQFPQATSDDSVNQIKKLADLNKSGILSKEEFNVKKQQLLSICIAVY